MGRLFNGENSANDAQNSDVVKGTHLGKTPLPALPDLRSQLELLSDILACIFIEQGQPLSNGAAAQNLQTTNDKP